MPINGPFSSLARKKDKRESAEWCLYCYSFVKNNNSYEVITVEIDDEVIVTNCSFKYSLSFSIV